MLPKAVQRLVDALPPELAYLGEAVPALYVQARPPEYVLDEETDADAVDRALLNAASGLEDGTATRRFDRDGETLQAWCERAPCNRASQKAQASFHFLVGYLFGIGLNGFDRAAVTAALERPPAHARPRFGLDLPDGAAADWHAYGVAITLPGRPKVLLGITQWDHQSADEGFIERHYASPPRPDAFRGEVARLTLGAAEAVRGCLFARESGLLVKLQYTLRLPDGTPLFAQVMVRGPRALAQREAAERVLATLRADGKHRST